MWSSTLQIAWKQRFFVPIEEERGNAVIAALLGQFPVIATEGEEADRHHLLSDVVMPSANATELVDLESWVIGPAENDTNNDTTQPVTAITQIEKGRTSEMPEATSTRPDESPSLPITRQASAGVMFQSDYRTAAIQIGFNFAESES